MEIVLNEIGLAVLLVLVALVTFWVTSFFSYSLKPKTYDEALAEVTKKSDQLATQKSPSKSKKKQNKLKLATNTTTSSTTEENSVTSSDQVGDQQVERKRKNSCNMARFRRADSLKNEHVMFADEINPEEDEKFSPNVRNEHDQPEVEPEGILTNTEDNPNVDEKKLNSEEETEKLNSFEETQPLDDLQLIRRKSIQMSTPSGSNYGSRANSNRGSRNDLSNLSNYNSENEQESSESNKNKRILKFSDQKVLEEEIVTVNKICKMLKKIEITESETNAIIELLLKKEESGGWQQSNKANHSGNMVTKLKKESESKQEIINEKEELIVSLQSKLKQLRNEFNEERNTLSKENRELTEANERLREKSAIEEGKLKKEVERLKSEVPPAEDSSDLKQRLQAEVEENEKLTNSLSELQKVIEAALKKIYPELNQEEKFCEEHQQLLEKFVDKMKNKNLE